MKKVSIILVNYNGYIDTVECVKSLKDIAYDNYEIIIVDNGSAEDFLKLKKTYIEDDVIVINSGDNLGFSGGNNVGIKYAIENKTDYILLLNNDTIVESDFLNYMVDDCLNNNDNIVVANKIMYLKEKSKIWYGGGSFSSITSRTIAYGINEEDIGKCNLKMKVSFASGCCMLIPVEVIQNIGFMNEEFFLYCEDTDYCQRIQNAGYMIIYEPKSKIYHKVSASTNKITGVQTYYLVRNKLYIVKKYIKTRYKFIAYVYVMLETLKRILAGEYQGYSAFSGMQDFCKGIMGKKSDGI